MVAHAKKPKLFMFKNKSAKNAFTVIEVAIIIPVAMLVVLIMVSVSLRLINASSTQNILTERMADLQNALDIIEQDISYSGGFLTELDCPNDVTNSCNGLVYPSRPVNTTDGDGRLPMILQTLMTTSNPINDKKIELVHMKSSSATNCQLNPPAFANIVYYISSDPFASNPSTPKRGTLYRKTTINNALNDKTCQKPWQQNTYSPTSNYLLGFSYAEGSISPDDALLKDAEIEVYYYSSNDPTNPLPSITNPALSKDERQQILDEAVSVEVILKSSVALIKGDKPTVITGRLRAHRIQ